MGQWAAHTRFKHEKQDPWFAQLIGVDEDFLPFYGLELVAGRNFSRDYAQTTNTKRRDEGMDELYIVNETAVRELGWTDPVGMRLAWNVGGSFFPGGLRRGRVIGVVKDFHVRSLHEKIAPLVLVAELKNTHHIFPLRQIAAQLYTRLYYRRNSFLAVLVHTAVPDAHAAPTVG